MSDVFCFESYRETVKILDGVENKIPRWREIGTIDREMVKEDPIKMHVEAADHCSPETLQEIKEGVEARNGELQARMEQMGIEAAQSYYEQKWDIPLYPVGGAGMPDALAIDPQTKRLIVVEIKGTGSEHKAFQQLGLINENRTENSPRWLDQHSDRLLERLQQEIEATQDPTAKAQVQEIRNKVADIVNQGGFEQNPEMYRSELFIAAKEGAMNPFSKEAQETLQTWKEQTGTERVTLFELPKEFVNSLRP